MKLIDRYVYNARFLPAAAVLLPVGIAIASWVPKPGDLVGGRQIVAVAGSAGIAMMLAQIGRGRGKAKEAKLFASWGGQPSVAVLRHRDTRIDPHTKARYHRKLAALVSTSPAPAPEQEQADPAAADVIYTSWCRYLLPNTRDRKNQHFALLFEANIDYGYRRNLWGMRPAGLFLAAAGVAGTLARIGSVYWSVGAIDWVALGALTLNVWLFVMFLMTVTTNWVKIAADAFAVQLLAACDLIDAPGDAAEVSAPARRSA